MLGNFEYYNPTKLIFGEDSLQKLGEEVKLYGHKVMLIYGGGSIKKTGLYNQVINILKENNISFVEDKGVMPNPTVEKLNQGVQIARENNVDFLLAIGGGSVVDYTKAVSVSINYQGDPWQHYYLEFKEPTCKIVPVGCVLTMVGTGSEMNGGAVITNHQQKLKIGHVFGAEVFPKFAILNPKLTYTVPEYQMVAGIYDIFNHICEQYFSNTDDNVSDYIMEGLMRSLISSSIKAKKNREDYEARSNIMWTATWALNTLVAKGKSTDWMVHMIGQAIGAFTDATHGMTLSAVSLAYYRNIMPYGLNKFKRFAISVFDVNPQGKSDEVIAKEGLEAMKYWMEKLGLVMNITDLGVTKDMINDIANSIAILNGGYKQLTKEDVISILNQSL